MIFGNCTYGLAAGMMTPSLFQLSPKSPGFAGFMARVLAALRGCKMALRCFLSGLKPSQMGMAFGYPLPVGGKIELLSHLHMGAWFNPWSTHPLKAP